MKSSNVPLFVAVAMLFSICLFYAFKIGETATEKRIHQEAVKACVAEYVATPEGKVEFRWISQTEPHQPEE